MFLDLVNMLLKGPYGEVLLVANVIAHHGRCVAHAVVDLVAVAISRCLCVTDAVAVAVAAACCCPESPWPLPLHLGLEAVCDSQSAAQTSAWGNEQ